MMTLSEGNSTRPQHEPSAAELQAFIADYYGTRLTSSADLKTSACCASGARPGWLATRLAKVHPEVAARFYGCGLPVPPVLDGATVLDLGCGTGRDAYVLAQLVGIHGQVLGVDMSEAHLSVAGR